MKNLNLIIIVIFVSMFSCSGFNKTVKNVDQNVDIKSGWVDPDTYVVKVTAKDENMAIEKARYKILKDIVNIRLRNNSRYSDIVKIRSEFEKPLHDGVIINMRNDDGGVVIEFQIRDKGLKEKFERK